MKMLLRCLLFFAFVLGVATPSEAVICCLINKLVECPAVREMRNKCRAKKAAHKMKAKKHHLGGGNKGCKHGCQSNCQCGGDCESECDCD